MASQELVLVTGGSGYLAGWLIKGLLDQGYRVRATARVLSRAAGIAAAAAGDGRLELVAADLTADAGWDQAAAGVSYVLHAASPMTAPYGDVIGPARAGTRRVLEAARAAGVRRVVVTSSGVAATRWDAADPVQLSDETIWADLGAKDVNDYTRAKTLAERDAWALAGEHGLELATVLPGFIVGPLLSPQIGPSMRLIAGMLGGMPAVPRVGMSLVDVRDVADLHIRAMTAPEAAGHRFIASAEFRWFRDIAATLRASLGSAAAKVPTQEMPDLMVRAAAAVNPQLRELLPNLGYERHLDHSKATRLLGWQPRPVEETIIDAARSVLATMAVTA